MSRRRGHHRGARWRMVIRAVVILIGATAGSLLSAWIPAGVAGWRAARNSPLPIVCESTPRGETDPRVLLHWSAPASRTWRTWAPDPPPVATNGAATFVDEPSSLVATRRVAWPRFLPVPEKKPGFEICSDAYGWPWMCVQRITTFQASPDGRTVQVDFLSGREVWMFQLDKKRYMIPLRPIWRGFIGNAAVFAGVLAMAWGGPGVVRRAIRRRRGCCVACGYSLLGALGGRCPECGVKVDGRAAGS